MTLVLRFLVFECINPTALAQFWGAVLRCPVDAGAEGPWVELPEGNQPSAVLFKRATPRAHTKGLLHIHLNPGDGTLAAEVARITSLGGQVVSKHHRARSLGWTVMADPEGNEFCVDSSDKEVASVEEDIIPRQ